MYFLMIFVFVLDRIMVLVILWMNFVECLIMLWCLLVGLVFILFEVVIENCFFVVDLVFIFGILFFLWLEWMYDLVMLYWLVVWVEGCFICGCCEIGKFYCVGCVVLGVVVGVLMLGVVGLVLGLVFLLLFCIGVCGVGFEVVGVFVVFWFLVMVVGGMVMLFVLKFLLLIRCCYDWLRFLMLKGCLFSVLFVNNVMMFSISVIVVLCGVLVWSSDIIV